MPIDPAPTEVNELNEPVETASAPESRAVEAPALSAPPSQVAVSSSDYSGSRWVDYDTHELLQMISDLEDERRWARLREGVWIALLVHALLFAAIMLLPKYVFKAPVVVDRSNSIQDDKEFTYFDSPKLKPKVEIKPAPVKPPVIDKQTLDEMNKETPPQPAPAPQPVTPTPAPTPTPPVQQAQTEVPRPAAVPARPNFALGSTNPADQLRDALKGSRNPGMGDTSQLPSGRLAMHPGAGTGGIDVLSDTQGVDFNSWIARWHHETERTWDPLIPDEVNPPILKTGMVAIRFKVLPSGRLMDGSLVLEGRSGDVALDRAAWGALTGSNYPPLPREFHGPYLELRAYFLYNIEPQR
ncbi:MAG: hypothetical protein ABSG00_02160 [Terracidiphilus sp.]|jgi:hypothetical protein